MKATCDYPRQDRRKERRWEYGFNESETMYKTDEQQGYIAQLGVSCVVFA